MKATALAHPNTAFVKYWGKADEKLFTPMNSNISMTLDSHWCKTTVEFSPDHKEDTLILNNELFEGGKRDRVLRHLDLIRGMAGITDNAKAQAEINFGVGVGLASSAAGFASLTLAACTAAGLELPKKELSIVSRQGSGSSCRSVYGGFVEWLAAEKSEDSYAVQIADENHFDVRDIAVLVSKEKRVMDTRGGMRVAKETSPLYKARLDAVNSLTLNKVRQAILDKDFTTLGQMAELDSMLLHATAITSTPILLYWAPETLGVMHAVRAWRSEGLECYYTADTGANVHVLCLPENETEIVSRLKDVPGVMTVTPGKPGGDAKLLKEHLF